MTGRDSTQHPADALPLLLAGLWPLGVYTQIPFTPIWLSHILAAGMTAVAVSRWRRDRACRPPFEYWWPCAAIALLCLVALLRGDAGLYPNHVMGAVFFLAPVVLLQRRHAAAFACLVFAWGAALAALLHAAAAAGWMPPTVIALDVGVALSGPGDLHNGTLAVLAGALAGLFAAMHPGLCRRRRLAALAAVLVSGSWLVALAIKVYPAVRFADREALFNAPLRDTLILSLALWLAARVMARGLLRPHDPAMPPRWWAPALFIVAAAACAAWGAAPAPALWLFAGLIAAHDAPWAREGETGVPTFAWGAAAACVGIQLLGILPLATSDPRNQAARCEALLAAQDWETLDGTLAYLRARRPEQPAYTLLHARSLAAQGWPETAAAVFCSADYPEKSGPNLAVPMAAHQRALLDTLRDQASRLPQGERSLFFERALVHAGEVENALEFLALHTEAPDSPIGTGHGHFAWALALLMGDPALEPELAKIDASVLEGYLEGAGVGVRALPDTFSREDAPVLLRAIAGPASLRLELWQGHADSMHTVERAFGGGPAAAEQDPSASLRWGSWNRAANGDWTLALGPPDAAPIALLRATPTENTLTVEFQPARAPEHETQAAVLFIP